MESYRTTPQGLRPSDETTRVEVARVATGDPHPSKAVIEAASRGKAAAFEAHLAEKGKARST